MVLSITLLMSGCSSVTEINKRAIVQVIGIDKENEVIEFPCRYTLQVVKK